MSGKRQGKPPKAAPYALVAIREKFTRTRTVPPAGLSVAFVEGPGGTHAVIELELDAVRPLLGKLTPSEREVASLVLEGLSSAEIGERRKTSARTVANQLAAIYRKLGVVSRTELLVLFSLGSGKADP